MIKDLILNTHYNFKRNFPENKILILSFVLFSLGQIQFKYTNSPGFYPFHQFSILFLIIIFALNYLKLFFAKSIELSFIENLLLIIFFFKFFFDFLNFGLSNHNSETIFTNRYQKDFIYYNCVIILTFMTVKCLFVKKKFQINLLNKCIICLIFLNLLFQIIIINFDFKIYNYDFSYMYKIFFEKRIFGLLGNPQYLSLVTIIPILFYLNKPSIEIGKIFYFSISILILLWAESRSAIYALIISLIFSNLILRIDIIKKINLIFFLKLLIILIAFSLFIFLIFYSEITNLDIIRSDSYTHSRTFFLNNSLNHYFNNLNLYNIFFGGMNTLNDFNFYSSAIKKNGFIFLILFIFLNFVVLIELIHKYKKEKSHIDFLMIQLILFNLLYNCGISFHFDPFFNFQNFLFFIPVLYVIHYKKIK